MAEETKTETVQATQAAAAPETAQAKTDASDERVPIKTMQEERAKRKRAQEEAAYWKGVAEGRSQAPVATAKPDAPAPWVTDADVYNAPSKAVMTAAERAKAEAKAEALAEIRAEQHRAFVARANRTAEKARKKYGAEEYDAAETAWLAAANKNPSLWDEARSEGNPAEYVYEWHQERNSGLSLADENRRLKAELEAAKKAPEHKPTMPHSNAGARGAGATGGYTVRSMDDLYAAAGVK